MLTLQTVGLLTLPVANMGDIGDVGRRQGMLFTTLSVGAILGPPISGLINTSTGGYTAVGFYAGKLFFFQLFDMDYFIFGCSF